MLCTQISGIGDEIENETCYALTWAGDVTQKTSDIM